MRRVFRLALSLRSFAAAAHDCLVAGNPACQVDALPGVSQGDTDGLLLLQHRAFEFSPARVLNVAGAPHKGLGVANHIYIGESSAGGREGTDIECAAYEQDPAFSEAADTSRYPWHPNVRQRSAGTQATLYGTSYAQTKIWEHQHPADCSTARFLLLTTRPSGIGCNIHFLGQALATAMRLGRVLAYLPADQDPNLRWYDAGHCPGANGWECWFLPPTNCTPHGDIEVLPFGEASWNRGGGGEREVPSVFQHLLERCSRVKPFMWFYWWRAQSVTYLLKFNRQTRNALDKMREDLLKVVNGSGVGPSPAGLVPLGAISAHVRHGDKARDAPLHDYSEYLAVAEKLAAGDQHIPVLYGAQNLGHRRFSYDASLFAGRRLLLSTEDPAVVEEAELTRGPWQMFRLEVTRLNVPVGEAAVAKGALAETLEAFLSLELALMAEAWICTLSSNYCRLIDELRMTVGWKAGSPFVNIAQGDTFYCNVPGDGCYVQW